MIFTQNVLVLIAAGLILISITNSAPVDAFGFFNWTDGGLIEPQPHFNLLAKRGCAVVDEGTNPPLSNCQFPTVDVLQQNLANEGIVDNTKACLFYLNLGREQGENKAKAWYCQRQRNSNRQGITWSNVRTRWASLEFADIWRNGGLPQDSQGRPLVPNPLFTALEQNIFAVFGALVSQAFAQQCSGTVYFFTPTGQDQSEPISNVWWAYELPALTLNPSVTNIIRVDPTLMDGHMYTDDGHEIWRNGQGPINAPAAGTGYSFSWNPATIALPPD